MKWYWLAGYGLAGAVIVLDMVLEFTGKKTLSEYVWDSPIPHWVWYAAALVAINITFWFFSPVIAAVGMGFYLLGHFAR